MDHCHVIVEADTTWKEDWIFKKSGINIYWFIFTTDTLYLVEYVHVHYQNKWSRQIKFSRCWVYCLLYVGSVMYCICPSAHVLVWVLLYGFFFFNFFYFVSVFTVLSLVTCLDRPMWLCCNLLTSQWFCGNTEKKIAYFLKNFLTTCGESIVEQKNCQLLTYHLDFFFIMPIIGCGVAAWV